MEGKGDWRSLYYRYVHGNITFYVVSVRVFLKHRPESRDRKETIRVLYSVRDLLLGRQRLTNIITEVYWQVELKDSNNIDLADVLMCSKKHRSIMCYNCIRIQETVGSSFNQLLRLYFGSRKQLETNWIGNTDTNKTIPSRSLRK
jgi:hypothetical protein